MSEKDGGLAFPCDGFGGFRPEPGMSLRDYFAAKAIQGMLAGCEGATKNIDGPTFASNAYLVADLMLQARDSK